MPNPIMPLEKVGARRSIPGGQPQKYFLRPSERQLIIDLYDGSPGRTNQIRAKMPHIPRRMISKWAMQLGLVSPIKDSWTLEEAEFLRKNIRKMSLAALSKQLKKDRNTIRRKATLLGLYKEKKLDGYSMNDLMLGFGMKTEERIMRWIDKGWLKGKKITTEFNNVAWIFTDRAIRDFIFAHPEELNQRKFDWLWIVDILSIYGIGRLDEDKFARKEE